MNIKTFRAAMLVGTFLLSSLLAQAGNTLTSVEQVTTTVELTDNVDYAVKSATPFAADGVVDIRNTDHAVLILDAVKPSAAAGLLASHVRINGQRAQNNVNCEVRLHNRGSIILPYTSTLKPLTVYSEPNFEGEAVSDFGLENTGGYMNTLTDKKLNNRIRSFRLKRGYMVTFSTRARGRGYSRCFIAAFDDLDVPELPAILDQSITSYRLFKWYDAGKPALANDTRAQDVSLLNVSSCYSFGTGENRLPDAECVPHHIYEDWPSAASCGSVSYSPHMKTNNEPRNTADDHPQDLATILNNWENLMATGMRLCSPSSWDGSDYWNGTGFLKEFFDSIDARGWRCDILDMHCYWAESNFGNLRNWVNAVHRPIWVSEWCWGASWNNNGAFAAGVTETQVRDALQRICNTMNGMDYVERYYYWNSERDPSHILKEKEDAVTHEKQLVLTPAGEMYSQLDGGVGYNGKYDYVPRTPPMYDPADLVVRFEKTTHQATLTWQEFNGEYNQSMTVERRTSNSSRWETVSDIALKETEAEYVYEDADAVSGCQYRVHVIDANGKDRYTRTVMAASNDLMPGDAVQVGDVTKYLGGNLLLNGDFDLGTALWLNGLGEPIGAPYFQVVPVGGADNGAYLQAYGNGGVNTEQALKTVVEVKPQTDYYFAGAVCNYSGIFAQLNLSTDGVTTNSTAGYISNATSNWLTQFTVFNSGDYAKAIVAFRSLAATAQFDKLMLCQLFDSQAEALADAAEKQQLKAEAFRAFNTLYPYLNDGLPETLDDALLAYYNMPKLNQLIRDASALQTDYQLYDPEHALTEALSLASQALTAAEVNQATERLETAIDNYLSPTRVDNLIKQPHFASSAGWTTKCGTYTGGDQRTNAQDGVTFWNAWWSGLNASEGAGKTMEIKQELSGLDHGLYALECKASTQHYCLSDQHAYITDGNRLLQSPALTADYFDLPTVAASDRWQTLTTLPIYVDDDGALTIGFVGSKEGATDNAWHELGNPASTGDKREGWWCATDFALRFTPLYRLSVTPGEWGVICLPYAVHSSPDLAFYEIAGVTPDYQNLCLREIRETKAGQAFIYKADRDTVLFFEYGAAVKATTDAPGNLRGFLKTSARVPAGYYYLTEGKWVKVESSSRPTMTNYTGIIRPMTDKASKPINVISVWDGPTMPIVGVTPEEMTASVSSPSAIMQSESVYSLDGRRADDSNLKPGIYIKVKDNRVYKFTVR